MEEIQQNLLNLKTYEDYLESLLWEKDIYYLGNIRVCRQIAELGMRTMGDTLTREEFYGKKLAYQIAANPEHKSHHMFSEGFNIEDPFLNALAERERANRLGDLSTIIFVRHRKPSGAEVSGYIDYEQSLKRAQTREYGAVDWLEVFKGTTKLRPQQTELGYFNWKAGWVFVNDSDNYLTISEANSVLQFLNKYDRMVLIPNPFVEDVGVNSRRTIFSTELYEHAVIYDHVVRKRF